MRPKVEKLVKALGFAVCGSMISSTLPAFAQSTPQTVDAIFINGSNIKRIDAKGLLPARVITREGIERSAAATVGDFVRGVYRPAPAGQAYSARMRMFNKDSNQRFVPLHWPLDTTAT